MKKMNLNDRSVPCFQRFFKINFLEKKCYREKMKTDLDVLKFFMFLYD